MIELYHYCPGHLVRPIKKQGLTLGSLPIMTEKGCGFVRNIQWLTAEPDPAKQSWATQIRIQYSRTEYRLTVEIPEKCLCNLKPSAEIVKMLPPEYMRMLTDFEGSDQWYVYIGQIPSFWIRQIRKCTELIAREGVTV